VILLKKFSTHPYIGLSIAHEFAHLKDFVRGNPHVDALRYLTDQHLVKDTVVKREVIAAKAEYKYLKGLCSAADLDRM
jgi:hypothetical protein